MSGLELLRYIVEDEHRTDRVVRLLRVLIVPLLWLALVAGGAGVYLMMRFPNMMLPGTWLTASAGIVGLAAMSESARRPLRKVRRSIRKRIRRRRKRALKSAGSKSK